jgi:hypothetical protein
LIFGFCDDPEMTRWVGLGDEEKDGVGPDVDGRESFA